MSKSLDPDEMPMISGFGPNGIPSHPEALPDVPNYQILGKLGEGGMGTVWRAMQLATQREVALKVLGTAMVGSKKSRAYFEREVELAARLKHPNIARVYDSGVHKGLYYYAMELVDGIHLDKYVEQQNLTQRQILELMRTVCQAVQHAHQREIIHRDIKPSNILVAEDGQPHILDFGLAKACRQTGTNLTISLSDDVKGTPAYMSPEQAAGHHDQLDTRTDVYSLGVVLYCLLTDESPHDLSGTRYIVMQRIAEEEIRRPRQVSKRVDRELEALLIKALARGPENRYATAGDLARDIDNYMNGEPLTAKPPTTVYFLSKRIHKYRVHIAVSCFFLAAIVSAVILVMAISGRIKSETIDRFRIQATKQLRDGAYEKAEQAFAKILALEQDNTEALEGISEAQKQQELVRDLALAKQYIDESRFDLALGLALSAQQRFPNDPRVLKMIRLAKGTTNLSVSFDLGTVTRATLKKITRKTNEPAVTLPVGKLLGSDGVDIDPGWYWLMLSYTPIEGIGRSEQESKRYLLFVQRLKPYKIHARKVIVGNVANADFATLAEALEHSYPGYILSLAPGQHQLKGENESFSEFISYVPNLTIESYDPQVQATLTLYHLYFQSCWDVKISNLIINRIRRENEAFGGMIHFENCVSCKVGGCTLNATSVDAENCDGIELSSNSFLEYVHHRSSISNSQRVVFWKNIIEQIKNVGHRTIDFDTCRAVLVLDNEINRSGLTGIQLDRCSDAMVACNSARENHEGNICLEYTDKAIIAFNSFHSKSHYNLSFSNSEHNTVHHNMIQGGDTGIYLKSGSGENSIKRNLVADSDAGIIFAGGNLNIIESNTFVQNKLPMKGEGKYWAMAIIRANLMDQPVDTNNLGNARLDIKGDDIVCQLELNESENDPCSFFVKAKDINNVPDLHAKEYGPDFNLKSQYLAVCNSIADMALEFGQLNEELPINKELGQLLVFRTSELADKIVKLGPPRINEQEIKHSHM